MKLYEQGESDLHYSMFLFKQMHTLKIKLNIKNLHYSMFLFKQYPRVSQIAIWVNLHYSMFLFKLRFLQVLKFRFSIYIIVCFYLNQVILYILKILPLIRQFCLYTKFFRDFPLNFLTETELFEILTFFNLSNHQSI